MPESRELLHRAAQCARGGQLREALALYLQALDGNHTSATEWHAAAWVALDAGEYEVAQEWMARAVALAPESAEYHNDLGICLARRRDPEGAAQCYRRAISIQPTLAAAHLNLGNALRDQGRWIEAVDAYRAAAALAPHLHQTHHALGTALRESGKTDDAIRSYEQALRIRPGAAEVYNDLGMTLARTGRSDEAIRALYSAIRSNPGYVKAVRNLSNILLARGRYPEAVEVLTRWVQLESHSARASHDLGLALARLGRVDEAIERFRRAIALDPEYGAAHCNLALALESRGQLVEAAESLERARGLLPQSSTVAYHLAALKGDSPPPACPPEYLIELFDSYADRFDEHLVKRLEYRGPELLLEAVSAAGMQRGADVIDLGCGTGLCGALFRPSARKLVGVDLSPRMIEKSRERGVYDELLELDLAPALLSRPGTFDVAVAADVFIYIGDLAPVFRATATALRPGGLFAFTIETIAEGDFVLRPSRRYAQSLAYVQRLADECGFEQISAKMVVIRAGEGPAVDGAVLVLRRRGIQQADGRPIQ